MVVSGNPFPPVVGKGLPTYAMVPSSGLGEHDLVHHVQLSFIFSPDNCPDLLNLAGSDTGADARIPDLVPSWESWRPPDQGFSLKQSLDASAYGLSLRAFAALAR